MRYFIFALFTFLLLQLYLRLRIDLRDLPGAAGSLSVYRALQIDPMAGSDWSALSLHYIQRYSGFSIQTSNHLLSIFSGSLAVLGGFFANIGLWGKPPKIGAFLLVLWAFPQYFALLTGLDTLAFGLAWFAIGLFSLGVRYQWRGIPLACAGLVLLPFSISVKESVLPVLGFLIWGLFSIPKFKKNWSLILLLFLGSICLYWSYSHFFPSNPTRLNQKPFSLFTLRNGWMRLQQLPYRGMPEGKMDQLLVLNLLGFLILPKKRLKFLFLSLFSAGIILYTTTSLGHLVRTRYIAPSMFSSIILLSVVLDQLWEKGSWWRCAPIGLLFLVFMDSWSFFYSWGESRSEFSGGAEVDMPKPPKVWLQQFKDAPTTQKDLSFYGAVEIVEQIEQEEIGVAVPRLRDDRHNSVKAFNAIYGYDSLVLDPGRCCAGTPVDQRCANRIVEQVRKTGFSLAIPTQLPDIERVHANERSWITALWQAAEDTGDAQEKAYWLFLSPKGSGADLPCQGDWR